MDEIGGELPRHAPAFGDGAELQADDADIDAYRLARQAAIVAAPVVPLDRVLEPIGDFAGFGAPRQVWNQETELVATETRVQIARVAAPFERQKVLGSDLIGENARDALDDLVPHRVAERVVVMLEAVDVDDTDAAPADALFDGEERLEALHEPV